MDKHGREERLTGIMLRRYEDNENRICKDSKIEPNCPPDQVILQGSPFSSTLFFPQHSVLHH
jgi:hypothetical protein